MEEYNILSDVEQDGKAVVKRLSDGLFSRCKPSWLRTVKPGIYEARSKTKAIRMDGLEWTTEG